MRYRSCQTGRTCGRALLLALAVAAVPACRVLDIQLWTPPPPPLDAAEVRHLRDLSYDDACPGSDRRRLDVYLPRDHQGFPVVVFVHGGGWVTGDRFSCGLYASVGEFLARHGIGAVLPNYRLSPEVKHPGHVQDVARAVAWTRQHIAAHGGDPDLLFVAGHSAGAHLVTLLATDETYLRAEGLSAANLRGVVGVSGPYHIPGDNPTFTVGGASPLALRLHHLAPLRLDCPGGPPWPPLVPGVPLPVDVFGPVFGHDPDVRAAASPVCHVRAGLPPFLLCYADHDFPTLADMAEEFHQALLTHGCDSLLMRVEKRNHHSIIFRAVEASDPVGAALLDFVRRHSS